MFPAVLTVVFLSVCGLATSGRAQDLRASSGQLSDRAFALLNSLTAPEGSTNPALGPVASFAADAQSLSGALNAGDQAGAGHAMASLLADRGAVDAAVSAHPGALNASDWNTLKQQLSQLAAVVRPVEGGATAASIPPPAPSKPAAGAEPSDGPKVHIDSYGVEGHSVRIKGFFEGVALKSAGIYQDDRLVRDIKVDQVAGRQHVDFDIGLGQVQPGMVLKVYDGAGLSAETSIASRLGIDGTGGAKEVELGPPSDAPVSLGGEVASAETNSAIDSTGHDVAEIPTDGSPSPSRRHNGVARTSLGDIQVSVLSVTLDDPDSRMYDVMGQITGSGVRHAGIYVDGTLAKEIDVDTADPFTSQPFDESFQMYGKRATIRVYGARSQYVEKTLRLASAPPEEPGFPPAYPPAIAMNPNQLSVQISSVRQVAPNAIVVSGVVSGKSMASAGLFQNGIQIQTLSVSGGILGALTNSSFRQVNFTVQYNPVAGPASVRVFDRNGQYAEQPVMMAGVNPYAVNPYGPGVNVYGPGAANPYGPGTNPYANPNGPRYGSPYGYPPPNYSPPSNHTPWWLKLLR